jgi:hypothetical protein
MATRSTVNITERFISHVEKEVEKKAVVAVLLCHSRAFRSDENVGKSTSFPAREKWEGKESSFLCPGAFLDDFSEGLIVLFYHVISTSFFQSWLSKENYRILLHIVVCAQRTFSENRWESFLKRFCLLNLSRDCNICFCSIAPFRNHNREIPSYVSYNNSDQSMSIDLCCSSPNCC